jgi:hypothetical protein
MTTDVQTCIAIRHRKARERHERQKADARKRRRARWLVRVTNGRVWAMPNRCTFEIDPIAHLLDEEIGPGVWIDPFAGRNSPATITNDLDPDAPTTYHMEAADFLALFPSNSVDGVLYDPPFSPDQIKECYKGLGLSMSGNPANVSFWSRTKDEVARVVKPGGKVLCFGWSSMGLGKGRGFQMEDILLVPHGGSRPDTICTVERKLRG